jgi:hypothetical protein
MWDLWRTKLHWRQVFSEYFGFPCHSFHRLLDTHHHPPSGASTGCGKLTPFFIWHYPYKKGGSKEKKEKKCLSFDVRLKDFSTRSILNEQLRYKRRVGELLPFGRTLLISRRNVLKLHFPLIVLTFNLLMSTSVKRY